VVDVRPDDDVVALSAGRGIDRLRLLGDVDDSVRRAWRAVGIDIDSAPAVAIAEVELRRWVREQSISWTRHRHGRLL
jgi:RHH-type transcriptional regulator, proline utilization regulon repressor / proline dehydrogenase / delta 1-pyrroline-5-carboxylate dehydrogenase